MTEPNICPIIARFVTKQVPINYLLSQKYIQQLLEKSAVFTKG